MRGAMVFEETVEVDANLFEFSRYYDIFENYLQQYSDEFLKGLKNEIQKNQDDPFLGQLEDYLYDTHQILAKEYPNILRKSIIITCYSYLEKELFIICEIQKNAKSLPLDVKDLKGNGIEQAKKYLNKVAGIDFSDNKTWEEIQNIRKIRNLIVHKDGILDDKDKIREYIEKRPSEISIEGNKIIFKNADYCRHVINIITDFHKEIYSFRHPD